MGSSSFDYSGDVVLVTGGTRGLGRGLAARYGAAGARLAVCARTDPGDLPEGWMFVAADLRDGDSAFAMVDAVVERLGSLDVVINNAGGTPPVDTGTAPPKITEKILALNLAAPIFVSQRANHHMQTQDRGGAIVNIGSVVVHRPAVGAAAYGAAKAGLANFTRTVGQEWAPKVRTNFVSVGMIRTERVHQAYGDDAAIARIESTVPIGRLVDPDDVAAACLFLTSADAAYITGADLVLDGGGDRPTWIAAHAGES